MLFSCRKNKQLFHVVLYRVWGQHITIHRFLIYFNETKQNIEKTKTIRSLVLGFMGIGYALWFMF